MLQVNIKGVLVSYQPDYHRKNDAWKIKNTDAFTFVEIGGAVCFVKRFEHRPTGHGLLLKWKGMEISSLPRIWDYIETSEMGNPVFYLFLEKLEGHTLREEIEKSAAIHLEHLLQNLLKVLSRLHQDGYWFTDFNEENIFLANNGRFYLIDLDSCALLNIPPNADHTQEGGLPGAAQESASVVSELFKYIGKSGFNFQGLGGKELNLLQILALLSKLRVRSKSNLNNKTKKDSGYFKAISDHIVHKNQILLRKICEDTLDKKANLEDIRGMAEFIIGFRALSPSIQQFEQFGNVIKWQTLGAELVNLKIGEEKHAVTAAGEKELYLASATLPTSKKYIDWITKYLHLKKWTNLLARSTNASPRAVECTLSVFGQYGTPVFQTLLRKPLPVPAPKHNFWDFFPWFKSIFLNRIKTYLFWFIVAGLLVALQQGYTKNWPQTYFLAEYKSQVNAARGYYNRALKEPLNSLKWNRQADSILMKAHFDEWLTAPYEEGGTYGAMRSLYLAASHKLHGQVLVLNRNYAAAAKHYEAAQIFFEQINLQDSIVCLLKIKNICAKIAKNNVDSLSLIAQDLDQYCYDSILNARISERIGFSECERIKIKKNYYNAIKCYEEAKKSCQDKEKLIYIEKSIAYCYYQIGLSFLNKKEYGSSNYWFLKINKKYYEYPSDIDHYIGECQYYLRNYSTALKYLEKNKGRQKSEFYRAACLIELGECGEACVIVCELNKARFPNIAALIASKCKCRCLED